jgi:hypothetical protein
MGWVVLGLGFWVGFVLLNSNTRESLMFFKGRSLFPVFIMPFSQDPHGASTPLPSRYPIFLCPKVNHSTCVPGPEATRIHPKPLELQRPCEKDSEAREGGGPQAVKDCMYCSPLTPQMLNHYFNVNSLVRQVKLHCLAHGPSHILTYMCQGSS